MPVRHLRKEIPVPWNPAGQRGRAGRLVAIARCEFPLDADVPPPTSRGESLGSGRRFPLASAACGCRLGWGRGRSLWRMLIQGDVVTAAWSAFLNRGEGFKSWFWPTQKECPIDRKFPQTAHPAWREAARGPLLDRIGRQETSVAGNRPDFAFQTRSNDRDNRRLGPHDLDEVEADADPLVGSMVQDFRCGPR
jgi:hypothetical protein